MELWLAWLNGTPCATWDAHVQTNCDASWPNGWGLMRCSASGIRCLMRQTITGATAGLTHQMAGGRLVKAAWSTLPVADNSRGCSDQSRWGLRSEIGCNRCRLAFAQPVEVRPVPSIAAVSGSMAWQSYQTTGAWGDSPFPDNQQAALAPQPTTVAELAREVAQSQPAASRSEHAAVTQMQLPSAAAAARSDAGAWSHGHTPVTPVISPNTELPVYGGWRVLWQCSGDDTGHWIDYDIDHCHRLEKDLNAGGTGFRHTPGSAVQFYYDTRGRMQTNSETNRHRVMRRVLVHPDEAAGERHRLKGAAQHDAREHTLQACYKRKAKGKGNGKGK